MVKVTKKTFVNKFLILRRNYFDRQGGDADAVMTTTIPILSDIEEILTNTYIQVKKKEGKDSSDIDGVNQLIKISQNDLSSIN